MTFLCTREEGGHIGWYEFHIGKRRGASIQAEI
jgi:hypothetical protein